MRFLLVLLLSSSPVFAFSRYTNVKVTPVVTGAKVTGAKIRMQLEPSNHSLVRIGLVPSRAIGLGAIGFAGKSKLMNPADPVWQLKFADQKLDGVPREIELSIDYAQHPNLKPGEKYQLGTVWTNDPKATVGLHVFGVEWNPSWGEPEIQLPK